MTEQEWLDNNQLSLDIWHKKYQNGNETFEEWLDRVSGKNEEIKELIRKKKFLFGGRILSNRGTTNGCLANCYSLGFVEDDLKDILKTNSDLALTFKAQGGQGISLSKIRPKGTKIRGIYESDGIVPFMEMFNTTTKSISQGGHRRGALMLSLDVWHKEAKEFIHIKSDLNKINNANLSLEIDDEFMQAVEKYYETGEVITKHIVRDYSGNKVEYDVTPIELYKDICKHAHDYAEPGILFVDRLRNYNLMQNHPTYKVETTNACSEQPLNKHGACILSSFNLSEYVIEPFTQNSKFDFSSLTQDINAVIRAMDDIVTENESLHILEEQKKSAHDYRNIGIGIMGLADALVKLGYTYGDEDSLEFAQTVITSMFRGAVLSDIELAQERGSFPCFDPIMFDSDIMKKGFSKEEIQELINRQYGFRNCSLLSIAPTGSIGTMLNISTGVEPFFALSYKRKTLSLHGDKEEYYDVNIKAIDEYRKVHPGGELPEYFVTSADIPYKKRIRMQAALQELCDTAISSTCNLPASATYEDVEKIYLEAWKSGCKGFTIYVEGSRDAVLSTGNKPKEIPVTTAPKRPPVLPCDIHKVRVKGEYFIVCVGLYEDKPYEVFVFRLKNNITLTESRGTITKVRKGVYNLNSKDLIINNLLNTDISIEEKAATLYSSMLLRHGISIKYIIKTAKKVNNNIASFSSAMCRVLSKYLPAETVGTCPECGGKLINEGGCQHCESCSYSKCE